MNMEEAIEANEAAIESLSIPEMRALLPVLREAERETSVGLGRFLRGTPGDVTYTIQQHRALMGQLHGAVELIDFKLNPALNSDLVHEAEHGATVSIDRLHRMVEVGSRQYEGAIRPLRIDIAAVMTKSSRMRFRQFESSAKRYAGTVGTDLRNRLMLGVIRGETVDQLTSRLMASSGLIRVWRKQGTQAVADGISGNLWRGPSGRGGYRWDAERLARTELVNGYNAVQKTALVQADREDPGWLMRWDAANDWRVCVLCRDMDGASVLPDQLFPDGIDHPPLHPCCRCCIVPWRVEWPKPQGAWYPLPREEELAG